jgi:hypothetical protein
VGHMVAVGLAYRAISSVPVGAVVMDRAVAILLRAVVLRSALQDRI